LPRLSGGEDITRPQHTVAHPIT